MLLVGWENITQRGKVDFPLNMTRRCAKKIVNLANKFVPELKPLPDAPDGEEAYISKGEFLVGVEKMLSRYDRAMMKPKDLMIICPTNAPLVDVMFKLQSKGVKAFINGGDITEGMVKFIRAEGEQGIGQLRIAIERKLRKLEERRRSKNSQIQVDLYSCLQYIAEQCITTSDVERSVTSMFSDTRRPGWIELSSIHKAKGREADTVVIWNYDRCDSPYSTMPWQRQQDQNLKYVAITRAMTRLYRVKSQ
jgi:hypothetical protein